MSGQLTHQLPSQELGGSSTILPTNQSPAIITAPVSSAISTEVPKGSDVESSLLDGEGITRFPEGFMAGRFADDLLDKSDELYANQLDVLRKKIYLKVSKGKGEANILIPPGVAKSMATTLNTELRAKGFVCKYRKYRNREHQVLRMLKIRLPKGL
jgi:hypothetical protein